ncbi:type II/IV secretion system protein [Candidatus Falkowbacteria bacterium]|nr:type II/IV secretion system protein [Candidatus Falkowbacteria bacterium]
MSSQNPSLGDLLNSTKAVDADDAGAGAKLSEKLRDIKLSDEEKIVAQNAAAQDLAYIDLSSFPINNEAIASIPKETAEELAAVCFLNIGDEIRLGVVEQNDKTKELAYQLGERFHANVRVYLISKQSLQIAIKIYDRIPKVKKVERGLKIEEDSLKNFRKAIKSFADIQGLLDGANITEMVDLLIAVAIFANASDFHIEAGKEKIQVRFRIDGVLDDVAEINTGLLKRLLDRIKLLAGLKINISDAPQDGKFSIKTEEFGEIDVRVSTIPTNFGESVVMRLLMSSKTDIKLPTLGLRDFDFKILNQQIGRPNGMILVTGPTGSGKTTTLYAVLLELNKPKVKIITLEDPIEYQVSGINQSQVDPTKNYSFASGLRSILRQDPDIIMIGEIRDLETAETAINASLTGHLLLSTVHTNSAAGAVPRLLSMDVKPFLLAPALNLIIAQRLVRVLCDKCKEKVKIDSGMLTRVQDIISEIPDSNTDKPQVENLVFYGPKGCPECHNVGYKGRIGIFELIVVTDEMKKMINDGKATELDIVTAARKNGMTTMVQDGIMKAGQGLTSLEEVFRVIE